MYSFQIKNYAGDQFINAQIGSYFQTVEELKERIDLWGLINFEVVRQIAVVEKEIEQTDFKLELKRIEKVDAETFTVEIEFFFNEQWFEILLISISEMMLPEKFNEYIK